MSEERLIELEIKMAYQEDLLQTLNGIVVEQQRRISLLEETCKLLNERIKSLSTGHQPDILEPPPPHY